MVTIHSKLLRILSIHRLLYNDEYANVYHSKVLFLNKMADFNFRKTLTVQKREPLFARDLSVSNCDFLLCDFECNKKIFLPRLLCSVTLKDVSYT